MTVTLPDPAVVLLVGASGSGKSTWAQSTFRPQEIVSSDALRGIVGSGEHDLDASADAFAVLDIVVRARVGRRLTVVVDTLGFDVSRRAFVLDVARHAGLPAIAVVFDTAAGECKARNRARDRPVPAAVLDAQLGRMRGIADELRDEGWDAVHLMSHTAGAQPEAVHSAGSARARTAQAEEPAELSFVLQLSSFPWGDDPVDWLGSIVRSASETGFDGVALMDHLIQIPQVGRAWDPLPEPFVTLGFLAGLAAEQTRPLRLGTLVSPVTLRAPGVLAKAVATLDVLTGGGAFCGVGAGWWDREHAGYGIDLPPVRERMDQLEVTIETLRALWSPGTKAYDGTRVSLPETTLYPRPISDVPIIVGGGGERRTLQIAAAWGDACNVSSTLATLDRKIEVLRRHCLEAGRNPADVAVTVLDLPIVGDSRADVAARVERLRGRTPAASSAKRHHAGTVADHIGRYRLLADRGVSTVFVAPKGLAGPEDLERFAPITAAFASSAVDSL